MLDKERSGSSRLLMSFKHLLETFYQLSYQPESHIVNAGNSPRGPINGLEETSCHKHLYFFLRLRVQCFWGRWVSLRQWSTGWAVPWNHLAQPTELLTQLPWGLHRLGDCDHPSPSPKWFSSSVSLENASSKLIGLGAGRCGREPPHVMQLAQQSRAHLLW